MPTNQTSPVGIDPTGIAKGVSIVFMPDVSVTVGQKILARGKCPELRLKNTKYSDEYTQDFQ